MFVLGVSWLVLTPLCLWNLFRGGRLVRMTSVLALVALEAATIWATDAARLPSRTPVVAASSAAVQGQASSAAPGARQAARRDVRAASCAGSVPTPQRVRPARQWDASRGVTPFWTDGTDGCATVVLRHRNRAVR
ncbi:hypothetical protein [Streptosporangium longisporum]|uniref:Uncharacterized protein n=1 Tax=Streptosporangium longisporum TaxID=46187 RepID=A0ABN3XR55_9ACTN